MTIAKITVITAISYVVTAIIALFVFLLVFLLLVQSVLLDALCLYLAGWFIQEATLVAYVQIRLLR